MREVSGKMVDGSIIFFDSPILKRRKRSFKITMTQQYAYLTPRGDFVLLLRRNLLDLIGVFSRRNNIYDS